MLCMRFPGLTPLSIRKERAHDVFLLMRRFTDYNEREQKNNKTVSSHNGKKIIRRPAGDDWF